MQLRSLPQGIRRGSQVAAVPLSPPARRRLEVLTFWQRTGQWRLVVEIFGMSRATLYRWRQRYDPHQLRSLEARSRRPHRVRASLLPPAVIQRIHVLREQDPRWGREACQRRGLRLFVLPPRSPKLNGHVERAQRTHTEEFYECYAGDLELSVLRPALRAWGHTYNHVRPHQALGYLTPRSSWRTAAREAPRLICRDPVQGIDARSGGP